MTTSGGTSATSSADQYTFALISQSITFSPTSPVIYGVIPITLSATATSGLPVSFSLISGPATLVGSTLTVTGTGSIVIAANQGGNATYSIAPTVQATIVVNPVPIYTVTVLTDDATGVPAHCSNQLITGATLDSNCGLRDAIAASAAVGTSTITPTINFASALTSGGAATITLTSGLPLTANMIINGPGANLMSINGNSGNFTVLSDATSVTSTISGLTITGGYALNGAGLHVRGNMTVNQCAITKNKSTDDAGGILDEGTLTIINSTVSGNSTTNGWGGGIENMGTLTMTDSTVSGNTATNTTGVGGGISNVGALTLNNTTVSGNTASAAAGINLKAGYTANIANSIILGNSATGTYADIQGTFTDNGGNYLNTGTSGTSTSNGNLASLGNYGGPTQTMPPLPGSGAICAGTVANITTGVTMDQRGNPRSITTYPTNPCVDAGAVQTAYTLSFVTQPSNILAGASISPAPTVQLKDNGSAINLATGATVTLSATAGTLSGTTSQPTASNSIATFSGLSLGSGQTGDTLKASIAVGTGFMTATSSSFNVAPPNPTATQAIASTTLSVNQTTSFTPVTGSGGTAPLSYSVSPTLPAGLSMASTTGTITGQPTAVSSAKTYTVTVTDANALTGSNTFQLTVKALAPTLGVTALPVSPSTVNTPITYTAQINGVSLTPAYPTGTVTFLINGSASPDCPAVTVSTAGGAHCTTARQAAGANQTVTATYTGDPNFTVATAGTATQTVTALPLTLGLTASPSNSTMVGTAVTFTAQLTGGALTPVIPSGTVNFTANGSTLTGCGAVPVNAAGLATCTTSTLIAGSDPITATYSGDSNFTVATVGTTTQTVTATTITTATPASLNYSPSSQTVTLSATVTSGSGTVNVGTVTFSVFNGTTQVGTSVSSGMVTGGAASATYTLPAATSANAYSIHAVYNASAPFATSSDLSKLLTISKATATVVQTVSSQTQTYNGSALSAAATTLPSGLALTYTYNGSTTVPTTAGFYTVVGTINDSNYQGSGTWLMEIAKATVAGFGLGSSANLAMIGPITLTATITSTVGTPSGTVSFMDSSSTTPLGQVAVYGGLATLPISTLTAGSHSITAVYSGDGNFNGATSGTLSQTILDFSVNPGTSSAGQTVEPGGAVTYSLVITPTTGQIFPVPATLTITGMPVGATVTVTPSTWSQLTGTSWSFPANTPLNAITLTVQAPSTSAKSSGLGHALAPFSLALLLLPFAGGMRRRGNQIGRTISLLLMLLIGATAMATLSGCGSNNGYFGQPQQTYTITATVTAGTAGTAGAVSRSTNLTLTVQ